MVKNNFYLLILSFFFWYGYGTLRAQTVVIDPTVVSVLVANHTLQQATLEGIKEKEKSIANYQQAITLKLVEIKALEQKVFNSMKQANALIKNSKDIVYASTVAKDIARYQRQMLQLAGEDPLLLTVAAKTELELINRTADLMQYIYQIALKKNQDSDLPFLLDQSQRMEIIRHVVDELRLMRGIAYGIARRMRLARQVGLWQALNPFQIRFPDNGAAIVRDLLAR
ncbi:hypothetical protein SAMN05421823_11570 [Catalinimonas alkaloidigena]|uniref:Plasmid transfer protein n=1 Tax=Catalinimonas alkaloidigena TaxID=1075417 RepID=A0A1G9U2V0_9BACT|nr:hypothetical protein [Catalinimonas alkaloidigena]SDM54299.1 hypothetical protein SAMN05421823_11570 [Catalinimonas alkaloidigena]